MWAREYWEKNKNYEEKPHRNSGTKEYNNWIEKKNLKKKKNPL